MSEIVINHATVRERADLPTFLRICAERGLTTVSLWADRIAETGEREAAAMLADLGLGVGGYNRIGPFEPGYLDQARAELDRAARLGADHVFVFTGGYAEGERDLGAARRRAEDTIGGLLGLARAAGMRLAIEPLHPMLVADRTVISSLTHANDLCEALGDGIGVVVDVHHVWWDERLPAEIARAGRAGRLFGFHVNDWLVPTRHLLTDRGMMGDGVVDLPSIEAMMWAAGWRGALEVEIFSTTWWARDPAEVIDIAIERCRRIFPSRS